MSINAENQRDSESKTPESAPAPEGSADDSGRPRVKLCKDCRHFVEPIHPMMSYTPMTASRPTVASCGREIEPVYGNPWNDCMSTRRNSAACGPDGLWWEPRHD